MDKADKDTIQRIKRDRDIERERVRVGEKERKRAREIINDGRYRAQRLSWKWRIGQTAGCPDTHRYTG